MCGRFTATFEFNDIRAPWNIDRDLPEYRPDGKRVESFTIITTDPNELVRPIHNRMPVILRRKDEEQWFDASRTPFVKAKSLLQP
jgi:putative SOS response-associated peptidase YedK